MTLVRRSVLGALGSISVLVGIGGAMAAPVLATGDANRASCSQETEAASGFRTFLPDCRAFESLLPPYKQGGVIETRPPAAIAADGEHVIAVVAGGFAGSGNYEFLNLPAYELTRTAQGWQARALIPPASSFPDSTLFAATPGSLETTLWGLGKTTSQFHDDIYMRNPRGEFALVGPGQPPDIREEELTNGQQELSFSGGSTDLSHQLFNLLAFSPGEAQAHHGHTGVWPGDTTDPQGSSLYEYDYKGAPLPEPLLVGVSNQERLTSNTEAHLISSCETILGSSASKFHAVSEDGSIVIFTALREHSFPCEGLSVDSLYARLEGSNTVAISEPAATDCEVCDTSTELQDATFAGASADGKRVVFATSQPLIPGQEGANLYEYDFEAPEASPEHPLGKISLVSSGSTKPEVQGVVRISDDGSRVYFVAKGTLTKGPNQRGQEPVEGADNLYVSQPGEGGGHEVTFVATLLTPTEEATLIAEEDAEATLVSEEASAKGIAAFEEALRHGASFKEAFEIDSEIFEQTEHALAKTLGPSGTLAEDKAVWGELDERPAQASAGSGEFLVFPSSAHLTEDDESTVPQLFEYDATNGSLTRVSTSHGAVRHNGNVSTFALAPHLRPPIYDVNWSPTLSHTYVAVSANGSRVFFSSAAALAPQAQLGDPAIYEYQSADVSLISGGADGTESVSEPTLQFMGADSTGRNAFFRTAQSLAHGDPNQQALLYDSREEGGFPTPLIPPGCSDEACRGTAESQPGLGVAATELTQGEKPVPGAGAPKSGKSPSGTDRSKAIKLKNALKRCRKTRPHKARRGCERKAHARFGRVSAASHTISRRMQESTPTKREATSR